MLRDGFIEGERSEFTLEACHSSCVLMPFKRLQAIIFLLVSGRTSRANIV